MLAPPPQGDPYQIVPPGIGNPGLWGCVVAWDAFRTTGGQVLDQFIIEAQLLQGVPM